MGDEDDGDGGGASGGDQREPTAAAATSSLAAMPAKRRQQRHNHEREEQETAPHHEPEEQDQPQDQQDQQQRVDQRAVRPFYFSSRMHVTPPHCPSDTHARTHMPISPPECISHPIAPSTRTGQANSDSSSFSFIDSPRRAARNAAYAHRTRPRCTLMFSRCAINHCQSSS